MAICCAGRSSFLTFRAACAVGVASWYHFKSNLLGGNYLSGMMRPQQTLIVHTTINGCARTGLTVLGT